MKINEKNLCYFATSPPIDLEGWLQKRGEVNKSWQRRYFVLKGNLLFYFEKKGDREPIGVIILEGCTIELAEEGEHYCFQLIFHGINNRTYYLSAETQEIMEQWMRALTCAGYEYMKLMVAELQRQLNEIEKSKDSTNCSIESAPQPPPRRNQREPVRENPFDRPVRPSGAAVVTSSSHRPAPPPPKHASTPKTNTNTQASNGGGMGSISAKSSSSSLSQQSIANKSPVSGDPPSNLTASSNTSLKSLSSKEIEFNFQTVHAAFGREIEQDLKERRRLKELAKQPLIQF